MKDRVPPCESRVSKCSVHGSVGLFERHRFGGVFLFFSAYTGMSQCRKENCDEDRRCEIAVDPTADPAEGVWDQKAEKELIGDWGRDGYRGTVPPREYFG